MSTQPPRFALVGAAGFVAPRHMQAIKDVGGTLVAALDPHDSVGILDRFDRDTEFFTDEHRFERHLMKLQREGNGIDWLSVCSPNYLHDTHIRLGQTAGARVICEKPLVIDPKNLDGLDIGHPSGPSVFTVLQLRHVDALKNLRENVLSNPGQRTVRLTYHTPRGRWYDQSWKGDPAKSGGLITNIGIHMLDMLLWIFGPLVEAPGMNFVTPTGGFEIGGHLVLKRAAVEFHLSTFAGSVPMRQLAVDEDVFDFTRGFEDLHSVVYRETLAGRGHGIEDARPAIELAHRLRSRAAA